MKKVCGKVARNGQRQHYKVCGSDDETFEMDWMGHYGVASKFSQKSGHEIGKTKGKERGRDKSRPGSVHFY